jgi:hypothetical protein
MTTVSALPRAGVVPVMASGHRQLLSSVLIRFRGCPPMCAKSLDPVIGEATRRLERINQLWIELAQLPHDAFRTPEYRQLVRAIRVEADTFRRVLQLDDGDAPARNQGTS